MVLLNIDIPLQTLSPSSSRVQRAARSALSQLSISLTAQAALPGIRASSKHWSSLVSPYFTIKEASFLWNLPGAPPLHFHLHFSIIKILYFCSRNIRHIVITEVTNNCLPGPIAVFTRYICDPMDCSMSGFLVLHYLPESALSHVP